MNTLRPVTHVFVPCSGCGNKQWVIFYKPQFVLSAPEIVCSDECMARHEIHMRNGMERQNKEGFSD